MTSLRNLMEVIHHNVLAHYISYSNTQIAASESDILLPILLRQYSSFYLSGL